MREINEQELERLGARWDVAWEMIRIADVNALCGQNAVRANAWHHLEQRFDELAPTIAAVPDDISELTQIDWPA